MKKIGYRDNVGWGEKTDEDKILWLDGKRWSCSEDGRKKPQVCCVNSRKKEGSGFIVKWCWQVRIRTTYFGFSDWRVTKSCFVGVTEAKSIRMEKWEVESIRISYIFENFSKIRKGETKIVSEGDYRNKEVFVCLFLMGKTVLCLELDEIQSRWRCWIYKWKKGSLIILFNG